MAEQFICAGQLSRSMESRAQLERKARLLAWGALGYHFVEFGVAFVAGVAAGSIALVGFGVDSLIEAMAGFVVLWLFTGRRLGSEAAERRAQQLIAASLFRARRLHGDRVGAEPCGRA